MKKPNFVRKLYNWTLSWTDKPYAELFLFLLAFSESSWFPIPPGVILIPLVLGNKKKWMRYAIITLIASVLGGIFGYFIGWKLWWNGNFFIPDFSGIGEANQWIIIPKFTGIANFFFNIIPGFTKAVFYTIQKK